MLLCVNRYTLGGFKVQRVVALSFIIEEVEWRQDVMYEPDRSLLSSQSEIRCEGSAKVLRVRLM